MGEEMRAALEEAVNEVEDENPPEPEIEAPVPEPEADPAPEGDPEPEPAGDPDPSDPAGDTPPDPELPGDGEPVEDPAPDKAAEKLEKAPVNWNPAARENWKELPEDVRAMVHKREADINRALQNGAESRKMGEDFNQLAGRYSAVIAAEGIQSPLEGFERVLQTMATLRMGSTEQKAQQIAGFIKAYNIDIGALDDLLVGNQPNGKPAPNSQFNQMLDERMQPVEQLMQRINDADATRTNNIAQNASEGVAKFGETAEFFEDVRIDMADLMDMAAQRNQPMDLKQAYDKACALSPEISQILTTRAGQTSLPEKLAAAASIKGDKSGGGGGLADLSMRETIAQLYNEGGG